MMKKSLFLFCIFSISLLNAATLLKFYHKDYQVADRSVFVFDSKPEFEYSSHKDKIAIRFFDTLPDFGLKATNFEATQLLKSFTYKQNGTELMVNLNLLESAAPKPQVEMFHFSQNKQQYKVVFDIISNPHPSNANEVKKLAKFYTLVGKEKQAKNVLATFEQSQAVQKVEPTQKSAEQITGKTKANKAASKPKEDKTISGKQSPPTRSNWFEFLQNIPLPIYLLILLIIIIILFSIRIFIFRKGKKRSSTDDFWHSTSGFGSENCQKKMISVLHKHNWDSEIIARELQLDRETVEKIIAELEAK